MDSGNINDAIQDGKYHKVKVAVTDIDGILRGKYMHIDKLNDALNNGFGFCDVVFGWDINDKAYNNAKVTGWHTGYPDAKATIDTNTARTIPWENNIPLLLGDFSYDPEIRKICPRSLLRSVIDQCEDRGFIPHFSQEFEWFNFKMDSENFPPDTMSKGMFGYSILRSGQFQDIFADLFDQLVNFGVPLEGLHTETGPGVWEAAIKSAPALDAADRAVLFKNAVKELVGKKNIVASFMAKWNQSLPGCSGHIHQSLRSREEGENLFFDEDAEMGMSQLMQHYLAGQLHCLPEILPMYAPTINSYKRLVKGTWAPENVTWGFDNRTVAVRVLNDTRERCRLELRVPGSDVNPYLAMAAALASGLYGIENELPLNQAPVSGDAYHQKDAEPLAGNLSEALNRMKHSELAVSLFGSTFVDHYTRTREWEWKQFETAVSDWELKRYFEIV